MADIVDRAILVGIGVEKKLKELLCELEGLGKGEGTDENEQGLPPRKKAENRIVDEGAKLIKEFISVLTETKDKLEHGVADSSEKVFEKLNVATRSDVDVVLEMARVAREKVDELEKRVEALEKKGRKSK